MFLFLALMGLLFGFFKIISGISDLIKSQNITDSILSIILGIVVFVISLLIVLYDLKKAKKKADEISNEKARKEAFMQKYINAAKPYSNIKQNSKKALSFEDNLLHALRKSSNDPAFYQRMSGYAERRKRLFDGQDYSNSNYGYDKLNPIVTSSITSSNTYLKSLRTTDGCSFTWTRIGSYCLTVHDVPETMVDFYQLNCDDAVYSIYISPYGIGNSTHAPKGMLLVGDHDSVQSPTDLSNNPDITLDKDDESILPASSSDDPSPDDDCIELEDDDYRDWFMQRAGAQVANTHAALLNSKATNDKIHLFMDTYNEGILPVLKSSPLVHCATFELLPAMFIVADFATMKAGRTRTEFAKALVTYLTDAGFLNEENTPTFHSRLGLYSKIIRGERHPRGDWALADTNTLTNSLVGVVAVVLGDIVTNPACADDYENAPVAIFGIDELMDFFQNTMYPAFQKLMELYKSFS